MNKFADAPRILVVDDEEDVRKILRSLLEREGFEVWTFKSGNEALSLVECLVFQAVLTDLKMSDGCGLELLRHVRKVKPQLPVILMTGYLKMMERREALDLGARGFLIKPFGREDLVRVVLEACTKPVTRIPVSVGEREPTPEPVPDPQLEQDEITQPIENQFLSAGNGADDSEGSR